MPHLDTEEFLRLEALRLAVQAGFPHYRQEFYDFLTGKNRQTPRRIIDAAPEEANVI